MKHMRKSTFFIFLFVFLAACSVRAFAETAATETQNDDQKTLPPAVTEVSTGRSVVTNKSVAVVQPAAGSVTQASVPAPKPVAVPAPKEAEQAGQTAPAAQPAMKQFPSGLLQISDYKYPVYLYVPANYKLGNTYPMIFIAPSEGAKAEEGIKYLKVLAERRSVFILSPHGLWTKDSDVPYMLDEWILQVKKDVMQRFPIDKKRVFIAGKGSGAQYASYLAMRYADQFAGAALIGDAWDGPFTKIMEIRSNPENQVPFYVALSADQPEIKSRNQFWFATLQEKGYPLHLAEVKSADDFSTTEFKNEMFDWLDKTSQNWALIRAKSQKSFKAKLKKGVKNFFVI